MRATSSPIVDEHKRLSLEQKPQSFIVSENIKAALTHRIQAKVIALEEEVKLLDKNMNVKFPLINKIKYQTEMGAIQKQHIFLTDCVTVDINGSEKDASFIETAYRKYQTELKELSEDIITSETARLDARWLAVKEKKDPVIEQELFSYRRLVQDIIKSTIQRINIPKPELKEAGSLLITCSRNLVAVSVAYSSYSKKRNEYEEKIATLSDDLNSFKSIQKLCTKTELSCQELQSNALLVYYLSDRDSINVKDAGGFIPLHYACLLGHIELAENLVRLGSKIDCRSLDGNFPVHFIARVHDKNTVRFLNLLLASNKSLYMDKESCKKLLLAAVDYGNLPVVNFLLNNNMNIKMILLALLEAATKGHVDIVAYLLNKPPITKLPKIIREGSDKSTENKIFDRIQHALARAYCYGHVEVVTAFFKARIFLTTQAITQYLDRKVRDAKGIEQRNLIENIQRCEDVVDRMEATLHSERHETRLKARQQRLELAESKEMLLYEPEHKGEACHLGLFSIKPDFSVIHPAFIMTGLKVKEESKNFNPHPASLGC